MAGRVSRTMHIDYYPAAACRDCRLGWPASDVALAMVKAHVKEYKHKVDVTQYTTSTYEWVE